MSDFKTMTHEQVEKIKRTWTNIHADEPDRAPYYMPKIPKKYAGLHLTEWNWGVYDRYVKSIAKGQRLREMRVTSKTYSNDGTRWVHSDQKKWYFTDRGEDYACVNYGIGSGISYSTYSHNAKVIIPGVGIFNKQDTPENTVQKLVPKHLHDLFTYSPLHKSKKMEAWKNLKEGRDVHRTSSLRVGKDCILSRQFENPSSLSQPVVRVGL